MDEKHSNGLRKFTTAVVASLIFSQIAFAVLHTSFGIGVGRSFGSENSNNTWVNTEIFVPAQGKLLNLDIALDLNHTSFCDLTIVVQSPKGTTAVVSQYDVYNFKKGKVSLGWILLDNESSFSISSYDQLSIGPYKPTGLQPLSVFYGQQSSGLWKINICDTIFYDTGTLDGLRLDMVIDTTSAVTQNQIIPEPSAFLFAAQGLLFFFRLRRKGKLEKNIIFCR